MSDRIGRLAVALLALAPLAVRPGKLLPISEAAAHLFVQQITELDDKLAHPERKIFGRQPLLAEATVAAWNWGQSTTIARANAMSTMEALMIGVSGMRGTVGGTLTPQVVGRMAGALAVWLSEGAPPANGKYYRVVFGRDSRPS